MSLSINPGIQSYSAQNKNNVGFGVSGEGIVKALHDVVTEKKEGFLIIENIPSWLIIGQSVRDFAHHLSEKGVKKTAEELYAEAKRVFIDALDSIKEDHRRDDKDKKRNDKFLVDFFDMRIGSYPLNLNLLKREHPNIDPKFFEPNIYRDYVNPEQIIPLNQ